MLLFTASIPRGIFCECSEAEVTENPRIVARNYAEMHNFCASRSVLLFTAHRAVNSNRKSADVSLITGQDKMSKLNLN